MRLLMTRLRRTLWKRKWSAVKPTSAANTNEDIWLTWK